MFMIMFNDYIYFELASSKYKLKKKTVHNYFDCLFGFYLIRLIL